MTCTMKLRLIAIFALGMPVYAATTSGGTVEYVRTIPTVREFTKPRGFFSKLVEWVAGEADNRPEILRPYSTAHDSTGRLLIADPGQRGVHIYDFEKQKYQFLRGPKGKLLSSPIDVACDGADNIYVTDSARAQIYVFDPKGKLVRTIGGTAQEPHFARPTGMLLDRASRRIYVTDTLRHQVLVLGLDGSLQKVIGRRGAGAGEFNFPTSITLSNGRLYVVDSMNFRIQAFTADGQFVRAFGQQGQRTGTFNRPKGIAADTDGNLYVVDALFETVQVFNPEGQLLYYFGSTGKQAGQFQLPTGISIDNRNVIYVADSYNQRVQVFRYRKVAE
jgi:DNA-binding beta-propeller fold protein YncE